VLSVKLTELRFEDCLVVYFVMQVRTFLANLLSLASWCALLGRYQLLWDSWFLYLRSPVVYITMRSGSHCALRLRYVDLVVSIEVVVEVCCCFSVLSC
jgi:hypothetical protein